MAETSNNDASTTSEVATTVAAEQSGGTEQTSNGEETTALPGEVWTLVVKLPHEPRETKITASNQEQVQDIRQSIVDQPFAMQYTCFHLELNGERISDFVELGDVPNISSESVLTLVEDPYNEKEARAHVMRIRELIGAAGDRTDPIHGIEAGVSLHDSLTETIELTNGHATNGSQATAKPAAEYDLSGYAFNGTGSVNTLLQPPQPPPPQTIKSISISPYNPPPYHLRTVGHLMYLLVTTNEGEQYNITSHVSGFFVSKSSHNKFDPLPKPAGKTASAHSLLTLLQKISPSFDNAFKSLLEANSKREPLALFQLQNAIPASPWVVHAPSAWTEHQPDITRTQEPLLMAGQDGIDTLRDWNEEFQTTRDLPTETMQDKVFRERIMNKLFADYNEAAVRGAVLVAREEVPALNPTEGRDAQIFIYNNIFYSFGADGVGTFATEGGDEAARVATGKDVAGVRTLNQLDIKGLHTPGTVIVDYLGKRIVAQSIVPGIFRQQEDSEHQIAYGGVEGKDVVADSEAFVPLFEKLSSALHVKKHTVWDKEGKSHVLEGSVETKGFNGTDARKYALDMYRLTPLDVAWIEQHWGDEKTAGDQEQEKNYPHRMTVLRLELIRTYAGEKLQDYIRSEIAKKSNDKKPSTNGEKEDKAAVEKKEDEDKGTSEVSTVAKASNTSEAKKISDEDVPRVDVAKFSFALNPDVYAGQKPQIDEEVEQMNKDEEDVRAVCTYLTSKVIPGLVHELQEGDVGLPMDGESLSALLHNRGINIRYLGLIAEKCTLEDARVQALKHLCVQEMVSRAFKHVASRRLKKLPFAVAPSAVAHMLNCLLGADANGSPKAEIDPLMRSVYGDAEFEFAELTPEALKTEVINQVRMRYRYKLEGQVMKSGRELQLLRAISLKLGLQLVARDYDFKLQEKQANGLHEDTQSTASDEMAVLTKNGHLNGIGNKKKKAKGTASPLRGVSPAPAKQRVTFYPEDILNFVPLVKEASPKSVLAEEAYQGGRISLDSDQKELAQELLMESLSLYEQVYGILHPEVARIYLKMATLYFGMEEKNAAVELSRKAVIVAERTLGIDAADTITSYLNLALFEHANGNSKDGLTYLLHALELWRIIYGPSHPDCITTMNNAAVMLQSTRRYQESKVWFEASLDLAEKHSGPNSIQAATILFQLGQALALVKDYRGAVDRMRQCYNIFSDTLGPEDRNTKEAKSWLEHLLQNAVNMAKNQKALQGRVPNRQVRFPARLPLVARPQPTSSADVTRSRVGGADTRDLDELIKYIGVDKVQNKKTSGKKKSANPKARKSTT